MSKRKKGSQFLIEPTIVLLPDSRKSLGEFKFQARAAFPHEYLNSIEGWVEGVFVYIQQFVDNLEFDQGRGPNGPFIEIPDASITKAKQAAARRQHTWLGGIHSHPWRGRVTPDDATPSVFDHETGHFHGETVSAIYSVTKTAKGRLYSPPIRWFIPQGRLKVVGP
jgi:hypothetical protein